MRRGDGILILFLLSYLGASEALRFVNYTEINELSLTGCLLLGINDNHLDLLTNLSRVFHAEPNVHIALSSLDHINWAEDIKIDVDFAFYKRQLLDRSCLLNIVRQCKAIPYHGQMQLDIIVAFLNEHCHTFRTVSGSLEPAGIFQKQILENIFRLQKPYGNCHTVDSLSTSEFFGNYLTRSQPLVIKGAIKNWPAFKKWSTEYLRFKYGHKEMHIKLTQDGIFEGVESAIHWPGYSENWIPHKVKNQLPFPDLVVVRPATDELLFTEFLDMIQLGLNKSGLSSYLEYSSIPAYMPKLEGDLTELSFVKGILQKEHLNMWLSDGNTLGKLHFDPYDNFLCQISGDKSLTLFEPHQNENLYEGHIPEALLGYDKANRKIYRKKLLESTSMVMSPVDITDPDYERFPNFAHTKRLKCTLKPGDVLYMPAFWWHEVQSYPDALEQRNLAVNYWYKPFFTKEFPCAKCRLEFNHYYDNLLQNPVLHQ